MTRSPFQIVDEKLSGRGLAFDVSALAPAKGSDAAERGEKLVEIAEVIFREGRSSALLSYDDRHDMHGAVDALRSLSVITGPTPTGDRYRRMADILARLLQDTARGA